MTKVFEITQPQIEPRPDKYFMMVSIDYFANFIRDLKIKNEYINPELMEFLEAELKRLRDISNESYGLSLKLAEEREQEKRELKAAAERKSIEASLSKVTDKDDKDRILYILSKLEKLSPGTAIYNDWKNEIDRLLRFYDSI